MKAIKTMLAFLMVISMIAPAMANDGMIIAEASAEAQSGGDTVYTYASVVNPSGMEAATGSVVTGSGGGYSSAYGTQSYVSAGSSAWSYDYGYAYNPVYSWSSAEIPEVTESDSYAFTYEGYVSTNANAGTSGSDYSNAGAYASDWYYSGYGYTYTEATTDGSSEIGDTYVFVNSEASGYYAQSNANAGTVVENNGDIQSNGDAYAQGSNYAGTGTYYGNYGYAQVDDSSDSATATGSAVATGIYSANAGVWGYSGPTWANVGTWGSGYGQATAGTSIDVSVEDI